MTKHDYGNIYIKKMTMKSACESKKNIIESYYKIHAYVCVVTHTCLYMKNCMYVCIIMRFRFLE